MAKPPDSLSLKEGDLFQDQYEIHSVLGEGGFGRVLQARQLSTGQMVAIKLNCPGNGPSQSQRISARFLREMKLCAKLHHPNIVRLLDAGKTEEGVLFTVLEFVPGQDLEKVLAEDGRLGLPEAGRLMCQVLDALAAAHSAGIVHRDLKPANIMVTQSGARRNATVLDFGVGAFVGQQCSEEIAKITGTMEIVGTPLYASPEQLKGEATSYRSDLYAWGLTFIECITGLAPMMGDNITDVVYNQLGPEPVEIPSALHGHPLGALIKRATYKEAAQRNVTAAGLLA